MAEEKDALDLAGPVEIVEAESPEEPQPEPVRIFFSGSTRGFYHSRINDTMPDDVVEISAEEHRSLLTAESGGKAIGVDGSGHPIIVDRPPPSPERLLGMRDRLLRDSHWRIAEDEPDRDAWLAYRKQLRELDLTGGAPVAWPTPPAA